MCNNDIICDGKYFILIKIYFNVEYYKVVFECFLKSMFFKQVIWLGIVYRLLMEFN